MAVMKKPDVYAVILAGGQSSRLFPFNKVLSDLTGTGQSLIQQAFGRLSHLSARQKYVLTTEEMVAPIRRQIALPASHFFVDPVRRGTWPALLWAMAHLRQKNPSAVLAVVTGDHVIPKGREFPKAFKQAVQTAASRPAFVAIPVRPGRDPQEWLGFGAIRGARGSAEARPIQGFEEKPSLSYAQQMLEEGDWFWNAGMFFFRISVAEEVLKEYQPGMYRTYGRIADALARRNQPLARRLFESFPEKIVHPLDPKRLVDNTIDYAVMMPLVHTPLPVASAWMTRQALTQWMDLGQWTALRRVLKSDRRGNTRLGAVSVHASTSGCIVAADKGYSVHVDGLQEFVVAFSGRHALVVPETEIHRVKELVRESREAGKRIVSSHIAAECIQLRGRRLVVSTKRGVIP